MYLGLSALPTRVSAQLNDTQLYLSAAGSASTTLTFTGSANTPGGSYPITVVGTLGGMTRTAAFSLGTQVTTFQVTSATGSAIVHNTGQEVQVRHNVPAGNGPTYTTCGPADPNDSDVACRVISSSASTVTLGITATTNTIHGTRPLRLN